MPKLTIDGIEFEYGPYVEAYEQRHGRKPTLIQFALDHDQEIPYFCYHPAMSTPTNCRMCLCQVGSVMKDRNTGEVVLDEEGSPKINWGRKPATACNQPIFPDMIVQTNRTSEVVEKAQKGVLEFILINHPLDCPICDQAGECPLQINTYKYGPEGSRFELNKVHKPKRIHLGPNVTLDAERCINCTRCTRFTEEITGTNQLTIIARGDKNFPSTGPGKVFDDPYSMNTIDLCPVGALTSTDFRFKARTWEMNYTPSICTGCARGCSIDVWVRDNQVLRLTPRENLDVNDYWMCDEGRLDYMKYNSQRLSGVKAKNDLPLEFTEGLRSAAELLKKHRGKVLFVGSAFASLESNFALKKVAGELGQKEIFFTTHTQAGWGDHFLRCDDRTPNTQGCRSLGFTPLTLDELRQKARDGKYSLIYMLEDDAAAAAVLAAADKDSVVHAARHFEGCEKATLLLPAATEIEGRSTFLNIDGIPQVTFQSRQIQRMTPDMWMAMSKSRLDAGGVAVDNWRHTEHIIDCLPSWILLGKVAEDAGLKFGYAQHEAIFKAMKSEVEALKDYRLPKRARKESFKMSQFEFAVR